MTNIIDHPAKHAQAAPQAAAQTPAPRPTLGQSITVLFGVILGAFALLALIAFGAGAAMHPEDAGLFWTLAALGGVLLISLIRMRTHKPTQRDGVHWFWWVFWLIFCFPVLIIVIALHITRSARATRRAITERN